MKERMFAAIDLGSNSFRMHIGVDDGNSIRVVKSARDPVKLGAGLDEEGRLTGEAQQAAIESLSRFREILNAFPLNGVRVVATNTMRIAKNATDFLPAAEKAIGYPIEIISGEEEGRIIYMGVTSVLPPSNERRLVIDIGGGSTELVLGQGREIEQVESFSIGTVKQSQIFFPDGKIDAVSFEEAILSARSQFEDGAPPFHSRHWSKAYGSSGTVRAIAESISKNLLGQGGFSAKGLNALKDRLIGIGDMNKVNLAGLKLERVPALVGGLSILLALTEELQMEELNAVDAGLRMGIMSDLQLRAMQRDRREQSVRDFMQRFHADARRAERVAHTAAALYAQLKPMSDAYGRYLYWSSLLHEIGMVVSHTGYHKHAAYIIGNGDMPGFTTGEQKAMSTLILAQKGNLRKVSDSLSNPDFTKAVLALRLAVMFMHSRIEIDPAEIRLRLKNRIELSIRDNWIATHPSVSYWLAKEKAFWGEVGMDFQIRQNI